MSLLRGPRPTQHPWSDCHAVGTCEFEWFTVPASPTLLQEQPGDPRLKSNQLDGMNWIDSNQRDTRPHRAIRPLT
jgi:hypothetical protein